MVLPEVLVRVHTLRRVGVVPVGPSSRRRGVSRSKRVRVVEDTAVEGVAILRDSRGVVVAVALVVAGVRRMTRMNVCLHVVPLQWPDACAVPLADARRCNIVFTKHSN